MQWLAVALVVGLGAAVSIVALLALFAGASARRRVHEHCEGLARALRERRERSSSSGGASPDGAPEPGADSGEPGIRREFRDVHTFAKERPAEAASLLRLLGGGEANH
ncbi:MAG: hypothetical protein JXP34_16625 [Planctomycetes bacterium]|nr:hypothetical protein [Planctomycetota bacterium]